MMKRKECIALILAGGRGSRLGSLTSHMAKPMMFFGGNYRLIDFTLSNCKHSGIDTIGILTQYLGIDLQVYINDGHIWNLNSPKGGVFMLPSSLDEKQQYRGTADAVYKNSDFIESYSPEYVMILSGDHVYKMNYAKMLSFHKQNQADMTLASIAVPKNAVSHYGMLTVDENNLITDFREKPNTYKSNLASMGIYIFNWNTLKKYLVADQVNKYSQNDFGRDIIPLMLKSGEKICAYRYDDYWQDVGTVESLWKSNMDLLCPQSPFCIQSENWEIFTSYRSESLCYKSRQASVQNSIISGDCTIHGKIRRAVLSDAVIIREGAEVTDTVIMPNVYIGKNAKIHKAVIGPNSVIMDDTKIGIADESEHYIDNFTRENGISLIGPWSHISNKNKFTQNLHTKEISTQKTVSFAELRKKMLKQL